MKTRTNERVAAVLALSVDGSHTGVVRPAVALPRLVWWNKYESGIDGLRWKRSTLWGGMTTPRRHARASISWRHSNESWHLVNGYCWHLCYFSEPISRPAIEATLRTAPCGDRNTFYLSAIVNSMLNNEQCPIRIESVSDQKYPVTTITSG